MAAFEVCFAMWETPIFGWVSNYESLGSFTPFLSPRVRRPLGARKLILFRTSFRGCVSA